MANSIQGGRITVDTASATPVVTTPIRIAGIRWVSTSASAGHQLLIVDPVTGATLWQDYADAANYTGGSNCVDRVWKNGFAVTTLGSGIVYFDL